MAELPKHYEVVKAPGGPKSAGPYEWWPVLFDGPVCRDEHEALQECIRHRNAVRVELLRELAAELEGNAGELRCEARWHEGTQFGNRCRELAADRQEWAEQLQSRAEDLEASGRTERP